MCGAKSQLNSFLSTFPDHCAKLEPHHLRKFYPKPFIDVLTIEGFLVVL